LGRRLRIPGQYAEGPIDPIEVELSLAPQGRLVEHEVRGEIHGARATDREVDGLEEIHQVLVRADRLEGVDNPGTAKGEVQGPPHCRLGSHAGGAERERDGW
jgi:hypothetical protein